MSSEGEATATAAAVRADGRQELQMRGRELQLSQLQHADGSCWYAQGATAVLVALHGPTLAKAETTYDACTLHVRVSHADGVGVPLAGGAERVNRSERVRERAAVVDADELQFTLEHVLRGVVALEQHPRCALAVDVVVVHDDGSLLAVAVNAVMCALLDAGVACRTTMAAVCVAALPPATHAAVMSSSSSSSSATHTKQQQTALERVYIVDPSRSEELCSDNGDVDMTEDAAAAAAGTCASTRLSSSSSTPAHAVCTVVLANPSSGGGMLACRVHSTHTAAAAATAAATATASPTASSAAAAATTTKGKRPRQDNNNNNNNNNTAAAVGGLRAEELAHMYALAERAAPLLFDFFRQCNVPLE